MIIIPLGLGNKTPRIPILTILITMVSFVLSVKYFPVMSEIKSAEGFKELVAKRIQVISDFCPTYGLTPNQCVETKEMLTDQVDKLKNEGSNKNKISKNKDDLSEIATYLVWISKQFAKTTDPDLRASQAFIEFSQAKERLHNLITKEHGELLSTHSLNLNSLALAQMIHDSWMHFIGNFIVMLAFGIYLEQRLNPLIFMGVYFMGGTLGLLAQVTVLANSDFYYMVGASANISAVMGAFFVLFLRSKSRFLVSLIVWNKIFKWPTAFMVPLLYIVADLSGAIGSGGSGVAHGAHLVGFATGAMLGLMALYINPQNPYYLYPEEVTLHRRLHSMADIDQKIGVANKILSYNPQNYFVMADIFTNVFSVASNTKTVGPAAKLFLTKYLRVFIIDCFEHKDTKQLLVRSIAKMPVEIDLKAYLEDLNQDVLLALPRYFIKTKNSVLAIQFYDFYITRFPNSRNNEVILSTVESLLIEDMTNSSFQQEVSRYVETQNHESPLSSVIDKYLHGGSHVRRAA